MQHIQKIILLLIIQALFGVSLWAQTWLDSASIRINEIRKGDFTISIKDEQGADYTGKVSIDLAKHEFAWGGVIPAKGASEYEWQRALIKKYYNIGVAGNEYKWPWIEGTQGKPDYTVQDEMLEWADSADIAFRGHTLIWGGDESWQMPPWTLADTLTVEELYNACKTHIIRDVTYWKGRIPEYDVVNEPTHEKWLLQTVGDSVNWNSFKWAHEADPEAKLYVNDFNILVWNEAQAYRNYIQKMLDNGAPISGIGLQAHMEGDVNWPTVKNKLDYMSKLELPLRITEFDIKVDEFSVKEDKMAVEYAEMVRTAFSHPAVNGFIFWALWDGDSWRPGSGFYDEEKIPKQVADTIYNLIHKEWSTNIVAETASANNKYSFNGFYGDYTVTVDFNGELREFTVPANKLNDGNEFVLTYAESAPAKASLVEARVSKDAKAIELEFDRDMDFATFAPAEFNVYSDIAMNVESIEEIDSKTAKLVFNDTVVLNPIQFYGIYFAGDTTLTADGAVLNRFGPDKAINKLPAPLASKTDISGKYVYLNFSEPMASTIENGTFTITSNGKAITVASAKLDATDASLLVFELETAVLLGDELRISFEANAETSAEGYPLVSFTSRYIENLLPVIETEDLNQKSMKTVKVGPNPVSDKIVIEDIDGFNKIEIYDVEGNLVEAIDLIDQSLLEINSVDYPKGLLSIKLIGTNETITKKVLKK